MTSCVHLPGVLVLWLAVRSTGEMTSYLPGLLVRWLAFYLPGVLVRWLTIYLLYSVHEATVHVHWTCERFKWKMHEKMRRISWQSSLFSYNASRPSMYFLVIKNTYLNYIVTNWFVVKCFSAVLGIRNFYLDLDPELLFRIQQRVDK